jgi:hypothetical protein
LKVPEDTDFTPFTSVTSTTSTPTTTTTPTATTTTTTTTTATTESECEFSWRAAPRRFSSHRNSSENATTTSVSSPSSQDQFQQIVAVTASEPAVAIHQHQVTDESEGVGSQEPPKQETVATTQESNGSKLSNEQEEVQKNSTEEEWTMISPVPVASVQTLPLTDTTTSQTCPQSSVDESGFEFCKSGQATPELNKLEGWEEMRQKLKDMGFSDDKENVRLLVECDGNLIKVLERLLPTC